MGCLHVIKTCFSWNGIQILHSEIYTKTKVSIIHVNVLTFNAVKSISSNEQFTEGGIWCAILSSSSTLTLFYYNI